MLVDLEGAAAVLGHRDISSAPPLRVLGLFSLIWLVILASFFFPFLNSSLGSARRQTKRSCDKIKQRGDHDKRERERETVTASIRNCPPFLLPSFLTANFVRGEEEEKGMKSTLNLWSLLFLCCTIEAQKPRGWNINQVGEFMVSLTHKFRVIKRVWPLGKNLLTGTYILYYEPYERMLKEKTKTSNMFLKDRISRIRKKAWFAFLKDFCCRVKTKH